jgi:hypothetical protein
VRVQESSRVRRVANGLEVTGSALACADWNATFDKVLVDLMMEQAHNECRPGDLEAVCVRRGESVAQALFGPTGGPLWADLMMEQAHKTDVYGDVIARFGEEVAVAWLKEHAPHTGEDGREKGKQASRKASLRTLRKAPSAKVHDCPTPFLVFARVFCHIQHFAVGLVTLFVINPLRLAN